MKLISVLRWPAGPGRDRRDSRERGPMETAAAAAVAASPALAGPSIETLEAMLDVTYTWGYQETRAKLRDLYMKGVRGQWISEDVLPWETDVDLGKPMGP